MLSPLDLPFTTTFHGAKSRYGRWKSLLREHYMSHLQSMPCEQRDEAGELPLEAWREPLPMNLKSHAEQINMPIWGSKYDGSCLLSNLTRRSNQQELPLAR